MTNKIKLSREEIESFGKEIENLYLETKAKIGKEDLDYITNVKYFSNALEIAGRSLIHISKDPFTWSTGVLFLGYHFLIEFTELGHNILHGQYDDIEGNKTILSKNWQWDITMDEEDWKFEHHVVHHPFTNILGKDNDFGFLVYRVNDSQPWKFYHLFQVPMLLSMPLVNSFFFPWYVATSRAIAESRDVFTLQTYLPSIKKVSEHLFKNYFFFPMIPGASYLKVAAGNFFAKLFQNIYLEMILAISHLHKDAYIFEEVDEETRSEFYLRQVLSTVNFDSPPFYEIVYGAINLHIEHHLFPDLPPNRLREVSPKVRAICEKYGVPYRTGSFFEQFTGVIENAFLRSFPLKPEDNGDILQIILDPKKLISRILNGIENIGNTFTIKKNSIFFETEILNAEIEIGGDAKSLTIKKPIEWDSNEWSAGSYISLMLVLDGIKYVRQYSLTHSSITSNTLQITVKRVSNGKVSNYINDHLKTKDKITLVGKPKGDFILRDKNTKILFLAGGAGITPILSMIRQMAYEKKLSNCRLMYFNRSFEKTLFLDEILMLQKSGLNCSFYFDEPRDLYKTGSIAKDVFLGIENLEQHDIYICAPKGFIDKTKIILNEMNFPETNIFFETFVPANILFDPKLENNFHTIKFLKSKKQIQINENTTLLQAIEKAGIAITSGCRRGMCKSCQIVKLSGKTQNDSRSDSIKRITTCNSLPRTDIDLDI